jgi:DNA-binding MarR family transcriptional regulator
MGGELVEAVDAVERSMVLLRRNMSRQTLRRRTAHEPVSAESGAIFGVLDALEGRDGMGVTQVAEVLGIDQPRASKLVARAVGEGLLRREADQADGRRQSLHLTSEGARIVASAHHVRRDAIAGAMATFSDDEARDFARLLERFVQRW